MQSLVVPAMLYSRATDDWSLLVQTAHSTNIQPPNQAPFLQSYIMASRGAISSDLSTPVDEKLPFEHEEVVAAGDLSQTALKSTFDGLSYWQTVKAFKLVSFYCAIAAFSAAMDGIR
jgi:hypothetical protein